MNLAWFRRKGLFFIPANIFGWLVLSATVIYAVYTFIDIDKRSHSASDTLMNFVFKLIIIYIVYSVVGLFTSKSTNEK